MRTDAKRGPAFYLLAAFFVAFVLFLYGPTVTILILSFQGPEGGLTFPMNGVSTFWFAKLMEGVGVVDIWAAFRRSLELGALVMVITVVFSVAAGLAYRSRFRGSSALFYVAGRGVPALIVKIREQFGADEKQVDLHGDGHDQRRRIDDALIDRIAGHAPDDLHGNDDQCRARDKRGGDEARTQQRGMPEGTRRVGGEQKRSHGVDRDGP